MEEEIIEVTLVKGLFKDKADYDAVLITHYHEDHIGLINNILHFLYKSIEDFKNYNIFNNY